MRFGRPSLLLLLSLQLAACGTHQLSNVVLDIDSSLHVDPTGHFSVPDNWTLQYDWDCSAQAAEKQVGIDQIVVDVFNADDQSTSFEHPETVSKGRTGQKVLTFAHGGIYYVEVTTKCTWRIQAIAATT